MLRCSEPPAGEDGTSSIRAAIHPHEALSRGQLHSKWSSESASPALATAACHSTISSCVKRGEPSRPKIQKSAINRSIDTAGGMTYTDWYIQYGMLIAFLRMSYRCARDSKPIEVLGTYNPLPKKPTGLNDNEVAKPYKELALDKSRTKYWLGVGAQPSDSVWKMFSMVRSFVSEVGRGFAEPFVWGVTAVETARAVKMNCGRVFWYCIQLLTVSSSTVDGSYHAKVHGKAMTERTNLRILNPPFPPIPTLRLPFCLPSTR